MKWSPQPKDNCARPDCTKEATQATFCMNHYHLFRRNGTPYRQDEIFELDDRNRHEREMDKALELSPPVIVWKYCPFRKVQVAVYIEDPHVDSNHNGTKTHCKRHHPLNEANTRVRADGSRVCRICANQRKAA